MSVSRQELIKALAEKLKPMLRKPVWADFVRTGMHKERPPTDADWWYIRGASILLKVQKLQPIGVSKLRRHYGGRKNRGVAPEHVYKGSGSIVRKLLQQLEQLGLLKQETRAGYKGRVITPKAYSLIAKTTKELDKIRPKEKAEAKAESKKEHAPKDLAKQESKSVEVKKEEPAAVEARKEDKKSDDKKSDDKKAEPKIEEKEKNKPEEKNKENKKDISLAAGASEE